MQCETHPDEDVGLVISDSIIRMLFIYAYIHYGSNLVANTCHFACRNHSCGLALDYKMVNTYLHHPPNKPLGGAGIFYVVRESFALHIVCISTGCGNISSILHHI